MKKRISSILILVLVFSCSFVFSGVEFAEAGADIYLGRDVRELPTGTYISYSGRTYRVINGSGIAVTTTLIGTTIFNTANITVNNGAWLTDKSYVEANSWKLPSRVEAQSAGTSGEEWSIDPHTGNSDYMYATNGNALYKNSSYGYRGRVQFKSNIYTIAGFGTAENPYTLSNNVEYVIYGTNEVSAVLYYPEGAIPTRYIAFTVFPGIYYEPIGNTHNLVRIVTFKVSGF